jgi:predicted dehydrogenase
MRVGIIGCGNISENYIKHAPLFEDIDIVACADMFAEKAQQLASKSDSLRAYASVDELLADRAIEMVINLTVPAVHAQVSLSAIEHGKHVWTEKPLAITHEDGIKVLEAAKAKGVRVGGAPDTFLGAMLQTARKAIDDGQIGQPLAATAFMLCNGQTSWHPDPEFFYQPGGGPMLDMGPYYITALLNLLGPIKRVNAMASILIAKRTITAVQKDGAPYPKTGQSFDVNTPDHISGNIEFASGAIATIITSFSTEHPTYNKKLPITIYGSKGALQVGDPNRFDDDVLIRHTEDSDWQKIPSQHTAGYGRAVGAADMAKAIATNRPHRGSAELIYNTLDAMLGFLDAAKSDHSHQLTTPFERPAPLPLGLPLGVLD